jgi:hypothetical protein
LDDFLVLGRSKKVTFCIPKFPHFDNYESVF